MRISHRCRFVFLSNPRTASRSIRRLLDEYSDIKSVDQTRTSAEAPFYHHMPASQAKKVFDEKGWDWASYHRFCIVRNPFTRTVSLYHHYLNKRKHIGRGLAPFARLKAIVKYKIMPCMSFSDYILRPGKIQEIALPLEEFVLDEKGKSLVDDILKYEELTQKLPVYLQDIGIDVDPQQIPALGSSGIQSYAKYYDQETQRFVEHLYRYEIDRFEYSFEDLD